MNNPTYPRDELAMDAFQSQIEAHMDADLKRSRESMRAAFAQLCAEGQHADDSSETTVDKDEPATAYPGRVVKRVVSDGAGNMGDHIG